MLRLVTRRACYLLAALAGLGLVGCGASDTTAPRPLFSGNGPNGKNATVHITPTQDTLDALQAAVQLVANVDVSWSSLTPSVVTVDATGNTMAVGTGLGLVRALGVGGRKADTARILVRQLPVALHVSPQTLELYTRSERPLTAAVEDANGYPILDAIVTWISDLLDVATVADDGTVTGVNPGATTVRAILDALSDTTDVTVIAAPYP
jgi:Big-like domain-containing protein